MISLKSTSGLAQSATLGAFPSECSRYSPAVCAAGIHSASTDPLPLQEITARLCTYTWRQPARLDGDFLFIYQIPFTLIPT